MFDLRLERRGRVGEAGGEIVIGAYNGRFRSDLSLRDAHDYRASWLRSAAHVLEHGYGRFLVCVREAGMYETWPCWTRDGQAVFHKAYMLPSLTADFASPAEAETPPEDYAERGEERATLTYYRCNVSDVAAFEVKLRGAAIS